MINTTRGYQMDTAELTEKTGTFENDREITKWVEYWDGDDMVHRSVHVQLKWGAFAQTELASFG